MDRLIVQKLQSLLEEALVIQQAQAQQAQSPPPQPPAASPTPSVRPTATPSPRLTTPTSRAAASREPNRRLLLSGPTSTPSALPPTPATPPARAAVAEVEEWVGWGVKPSRPLGDVVKEFLHKVLALLQLLELRLRRRLTELREGVMQSVKVGLATSTLATSTSSLYDRLSAQSSAMLSSIHSALTSPVITLHYPAVLSGLIPAFLTSTTLPSPLPHPSPCPTSTPLRPFLLATPAPSPSASPPPPSPPTPSHPAPPSSPPPPASDPEKELLRATILHLHSLLTSHASSLTSAHARLSMENAELRELIEVQEEQLGRQQSVLQEVRRELERQVAGGEGGLGGVGVGGWMGGEGGGGVGAGREWGGGVGGEEEEGEGSEELTVDERTMSRLMREEWNSDTSLLSSC